MRGSTVVGVRRKAIWDARALHVLYDILGLILIAVGMLDVFLTVLAYDASGLVVEPGYRLFWRGIDASARHLPVGIGAVLRSIGAPLMVIGSVATWMALQIVGFALLYLPGITGDGFDLHGLPGNFWTALYVSGSTISGLTFAGAEPAHGAYFYLEAVETLVGVTILSLAIAYVLGLYGVVQDAAVARVTMQNYAAREDSAANLLAPHFHAPSIEGLSVLWRDLHANLAVYMEGMRRYPVAYYFHTRHRNRSLPATLRLTAEAASAVRWALPPDHPAVRDPWLPGLLEAYQQAEREITERFLITAPLPVDPVADRLAFEEHAEDRGARFHPSIEAFCEVQAIMAGMAGTEERPAVEDFERYRQWWGFVGPARAFAAAVATDFGAVDPDPMEGA